MKKKITYLLMVALIAFSLVMPCYADEVTIPEETTLEETTEAITEAVTEPTEGVEEEVEQTPETEAETPTEEAFDLSAVLTEVKGKITDSAVWTMVGTSVVSLITFIGILTNKFGWLKNVVEVIKDALGGKADKEDVKNALDGAKEELTKEFKEAYAQKFDDVTKMLKQQGEALTAAAENEKKLYAMLTLFMTNCKISESAKAEILNLATDVKKYSGDVYEIVEQVQEAIEADIAEAEKDTPPTPTLDEILEEEYMELG